VEAHLDFSPISAGATTVAAGSNGQAMPQGTINVGSTATFPKFGNVTIAGITGTVQYTGITGTTLTGCTGGTGTLATGAAVASAPYQQRPIMIQLDRDTGDMNQFQLSATSLAFADWATQIEFASLGMGAFSMLAVAGVDNSFSLNAAAGRTSAFIMQYNATTAFGIAPNSATNVAVGVGGTNILSLFGGGSTKRMNLGPTADNTHVFTSESDNGNTAINARGFSTQVGDLFRAETNGQTQLWGVTKDGIMRNANASNEATGAGSAALGSNCPAVTATAPYKWVKMLSSDGSTVYVPAWK
jgi:hypothetical protein